MLRASSEGNLGKDFSCLSLHSLDGASRDEEGPKLFDLKPASSLINSTKGNKVAQVPILLITLGGNSKVLILLRSFERSTNRLRILSVFSAKGEGGLILSAKKYTETTEQ